MTFLADQLAAKRLEIFKEAAPRLSRVGLLRDPTHIDNEMPVAQRAAEALKLDLRAIEMRNPAELDRALEVAGEANIDGLYVVSSRHTVANTPTDRRVREPRPSAFGWRMGGLGSGGRVEHLYGPNVEEMIGQASAYLDKVLEGAKLPADLPVQQPTRFELLINLRTAKALGLTISPMLLARANKVIE